MKNRIINLIKKVVYSNRLTANLWKLFVTILRVGPVAAIKKIKYNYYNKNRKKYYYRDHILTKNEVKSQKQFIFKNNIKISVIVPLYNTPENFLTQMIQSVINQTYSNWELCLADGSDDDHKIVHDICNNYINTNKNIIYKKLEKNLGISENTNACIELATGDYLALLDHDDILGIDALFEVVKVINEKNADFIYSDETTFSDTPSDAYCYNFKPDFAPDTLRSVNYICHLSVFKRELLEKSGYFRSEFDGSQDYDLFLRLTENAKNIIHIPKVLYYWRCHKNSVAFDVSAKPYTIKAAKKALQSHLERIGLKGEIIDAPILSTYKINYELTSTPLISILIPNKDHINDLKKCINSILNKSTYKNFEIIIIENNSQKKSTFEYYKDLETNSKIKIITWNGEFNYSAINNFGTKNSSGEYIVLLNNDIEIITPNWIEEMLMYAQRDDVGAVGVKLHYPDNTLQHAGVVIGIGGVAGHSHRKFPSTDPGYMGRLLQVQNIAAVTAAFLMTKRSIFDEINGLDENYKVAFNDVDYCMKITQIAKKLIVFNPFVEAYHYESKSRGLEDTPEKQMRFTNETKLFLNKWAEYLKNGDPYYNTNLSLDHEDFSFK